MVDAAAAGRGNEAVVAIDVTDGKSGTKIVELDWKQIRAAIESGTHYCLSQSQYAAFVPILQNCMAPLS